MFLLYVGLSIFAIVIGIYFGIKLSGSIGHPILYFLFWILYLISVLSLLNISISVAYYLILKHKRGPPGPRGEKGGRGGSGTTGNCETGCKDKVCNLKIMRAMNIKFNKLMTQATRKEYDPPLAINNNFIRETIKRICHSDQFKEVARIKQPYQVLEYIISIWEIWIELLFDADPSKHKDRFKTWLETHGADNEWEAISAEGKSNPFDEIKKYDIYYWGLSKEFRPVKIQYCKPNNVFKQDYTPPKIRAIESNFYEWIYNDRGSGSDLDGEIWRGKPTLYQGRWYYPLGDVAWHQYGGQHSRRYLREYGTPHRGMTDNNQSDRNGPAHTTVFVDGSSKHVESPQSYDIAWYDGGSGGDHDVVFWMPRDFTKDGKKFKCFGGVALRGYGNNPLKTYGKNQPIKCIDEACLEKIPAHQGSIWNDSGSGAELDGSIWTNKSDQYSPYKVAYYPRFKHSPDNRQFYKIKKDCMTGKNNLEKTPTYADDRLGYGWHGTPKRQGSYSIFNFLDLVVESKIINSSTGESYYLAHTGDTIPNAYFVKVHNKRTDTYINCIKNRGGMGYDNGTCDMNNPDEIWEVEFANFDPSKFLLKSKSRGSYLYLEKHNDGKYYARNKSISVKIKTDKNLARPYIWHFEDAADKGKLKSE